MSMIALDTPLAEALSTTVHTKIVEDGWVQEDDTSLAEYIVLMLANGKTQEQIASELAGELLQDAKGTTEFSQWLFEQVNVLSDGGGSTSQHATGQAGSEQPQEVGTDSAEATNSMIPAAYDMDMGDNAPDNAPRGPKGLHGGRSGGRGGRGGAHNKSGDAALHRVRGNDRINSHGRGAPKGPRSGPGRDVRPGMQKALNNMGMTGPAPGMPNPMMQNGGQQGQSMMPMSPQQQMEFMAMMEQQARMMAQFMPGMAPQGMNGGFQQNGAQTQQGRSLFDRVEPGRGRGGGRGRGRGGIQQNGAMRNANNATSTEASVDGEIAGGEGASMDVDQQQRKSHDPATTMCHFNLRCTNKDCLYAHQSPAAPPGIVVDMADTCSFGAACKNSNCVGRHPSPAQIKAHQAEELCKYFPNCTNPMCSFKHPSMPVCSFGANCKNKECKFTHLPTPCRFNPCLNPRCIYKHEPGQNKTFADYSWTPESAKQKEEEAAAAAREHVSDRKFIADDAGEEELIRPEQNGQEEASANGAGQSTGQEEVMA